jgi:DNA repair exonuclease SbcCD ATPase subunit
LVESARKEEEAARQAEKEWLARQGVSSPEEYLQKVGRHAQLQASLMRQGQGDSGVVDPVEERRGISSQIKDLEEEGIPRLGLDPAALQRLHRQAQDLETTRQGLEREEKRMLQDTSLQAGAVRGTLGKLAAEIVRAEEVLLQLEDQIKELECDRRAAAIAHGIFKEIGEGADLLLAGLARELEAVLEPILPGGRAVALLGLDQKQITVQDAGGGKRALENLSSGTRDAVVLAAKLALAVKAREGKGLLLLDDPFQSMDREREERALRMIQEFHLRHGWQVILLTKDAHLRDGMVRRFPDCRTVEL